VEAFLEGAEHSAELIGKVHALSLCFLFEIVESERQNQLRLKLGQRAHGNRNEA
jgi:hypothetical protein